VNFDDQDWEYGHPAALDPDRDTAEGSAVWKVAAGVAVGIVIGAAAMYLADRHIDGLAWSETARPANQLTPRAASTIERVPAPANGQASAQAAAAPLAGRPASPPSDELPRMAAPSSAVAADAARRQAGATPGGPLSEVERKQRAWSRYYKKPPYCEENPSSDVLIECANHYIRARRQFEEAYAAGKL
jgi:hypothetical protein